MRWFKKLREEIKRERAANSAEWKQLKFASFILAAGLIYVGYTRIRDEGPWYLGCSSLHGKKEVLLQTDKKPRVEGSIVFLGDDMFVTPEPGMTCRILTVRKAEAELEAREGLDNPI